MKLLKKNKMKNDLNTELKEMGVFSAVAGNQLPNQLQKRVLPALFHLWCPSQSHQRSARGRTRLTTVTSISCRSFQRQLLYLSQADLGPTPGHELLFSFYFQVWNFSVKICAHSERHKSYVYRASLKFRCFFGTSHFHQHRSQVHLTFCFGFSGSFDRP